MMEVRFRTNKLKRCYEQRSRAVREWGPDVGPRYIKAVTQLQALSSLTAAYQVRSLRLHQLVSSQRGELSITLTGRWRLIITQGESDDSVVIEEVSDHYDD